MTILDKKELRKEKLEELQGLINTKNEREDQKYTDEEVTRFDALEEEVRSLDAEIDQLEKEEKISKRKNVIPNKKSEEKRAAEQFSFGEAVRQASKGEFTGLYAELNQEGRSEAAAANVPVSGQGIVLPEFALRAENTAVTGTQPADGGALVQTDYKGMIEHLYDGTIFNSIGATFLNGLKGNPEMPTEDSVVSASWETEIAQVSTQKAGFGNQNMSPNRLAAAVAYSTQLLLQSTPSIDAVLRRQIEQAIQQKLDDCFINGNGGNIGGLEGDITGTLGLTSLTYADLVEIVKFQVTSNRGGNFKVLSSPAVMAKLMDTYRNDQGTGAPLLQGSTLATGMPFVASNKVSDTLGAGSDESGIYCADFSDIYVGAWGGLQMTVDNLTLADQAKTKIVVNSFWDMHNTRPAKMTKDSVAIA